MLVLNIGCAGWDTLGVVGRGETWPQAKEIGLDLNPDQKPDVVADMRHLPFKDECLYGVLASHVLEHVPLHEVGVALKEMNRVLRPQGELVVHVPDMRFLAKKILHDGMTPFLNRMVYSEPDRPFQAHLCGFDVPLLVAAIRLAGFEETGAVSGLIHIEWQGQVRPGWIFRDITVRARKK